MPFKLNFMPTAIGSLPHTDAAQACDVISAFLPEIPIWPQLPKLSFMENMYTQFSEKFPGVVVDKGAERIYVDRSKSRDFDADLEKLYVAYLNNDVEEYGISPAYSSGLQAFLASGIAPLQAVKGHITGPISWGLTVTDQNRRSVLYDEVLADALAKFLRLKATWEERILKAVSPNTIIFVDEPYMSAFGSAFVSVSREQVIGYLDEVMSGISGLKGIHCCGNTDWSILLSTPVDILSFDAYNFAESLSLFPQEVGAFLARGGVIAWGIVPNDAEVLAAETLESLVERLKFSMEMLVKKGVDQALVFGRALITPSCGLGSTKMEAVVKAFELLSGVSARMRESIQEESSP